MPKTSPLPNWAGQDVFLIGGGRSLRYFDFSQLKYRNTIGCNQAFELGPEICKISFFGDFRFWEAYKDRLADFAGWVATNYQAPPLAPWVKHFRRQDEGLAGDSVAWNANSGAAIINLALILGARRVFCLGYDCCGGAEGTNHWHGRAIEQQTPQHYARFLEGFSSVAQSLPALFPGREVWNVTEGGSRLEAFPCCSFERAGLSSPILEGALS